MISEMYRKQDGQTLKITGHLSKAEINSLKRNGYRFDNPDENKNGIKLAK
ncbi:hypothetical protein [Lentibacillus salicampi]|nr:hypothetical protein [Lentibacillus salicampi]